MPELGILGNQTIIELDSAGNLSWPENETKRVCWGVGADDRWHFSDSWPARVHAQGLNWLNSSLDWAQAGLGLSWLESGLTWF